MSTVREMETPSPIDYHDMEEETDLPNTLSFAYQIERVMYAIAILLGFIASVYTIRKFRRCCKKNLDVAARLLSYKISLSVADALILFVYAPTQLVWISTFWWYGGEILCRVYKFTITFAFHLTGNMQVLIAFDRLITMTRINKMHVKGTSDYNTGLFLSLSWILALASSAPQLFIFKIVYHNDTNPQCSSIWNEYTYLMEKEESKRINENDDYSADNETMASSFSDSSIREEWIRMQEWEKLYNIVHVSMMCVIPYLLELIFYALILSLLSDAEKGEFSGFRRFIHKKIVRLCHMKRREERKERFNSLPTVVEDAQSDSPVDSPHKVTLTRRPSRSVNSSPTHGRRLDVLRVSYHRNRFQSVDVGMRRMTMAMDTHVSSPLHSNGTGETSHLLSIRHQSRRASAPCGNNKLNEPRVSVPWMRTVIVARKNARRKAFLMLSFNLLLWLPYCAHAILSSFVELNYFNFQFACALVVFNAITNILL